jgi:hypothetical protein
MPCCQLTLNGWFYRRDVRSSVSKHIQALHAEFFGLSTDKHTSLAHRNSLDFTRPPSLS